MSVLPQRYVSVDLDVIEPHPANPNRGNVDLIAESISANGFYGAIVVQESTGRILAGEHRWRAARLRDEAQVPVIYVDVDDATALRILAADNRTSELAHRDPDALVDLLTRLADVEDGLYGSGYAPDDLADLLAQLNPPSLEDLADAYGEPAEDDFWPVIRVKVHPDTHARYESMIGGFSGDDAARFTALIDAAEAGLAEA